MKLQNYPLQFKSPFLLKNYINNRAIDMVAPQIVDAINNNTQQLQQWTKAVNLEIKNKKLHEKVLKGIDKSNKILVKTMQDIKNNILRVKYEGRDLSPLEKKLIK